MGAWRQHHMNTVSIYPSLYESNAFSGVLGAFDTF